MPENSYVVEDSKSFAPAYTKEEIDEIMSGKPQIYSGEDAPDNSLGNDGDIYIQF